LAVQVLKQHGLIAEDCETERVRTGARGWDHVDAAIVATEGFCHEPRHMRERQQGCFRQLGKEAKREERSHGAVGDKCDRAGRENLFVPKKERLKSSALMPDESEGGLSLLARAEP
jgi:hypothetical protein